MIVDEKYLLDKQKEEIEYLAEDNKRLNELVASGTEVMDYWNNKYLEERAKNENLQKQVDELTEQRDVFKRLFESVNMSNVSTSCIIDTMNSFYREQAGHLAGLKIEQAVKDAVKKFADLVEFHSVATMEDNVEYFTISVLGVKEILRENFDVR